MMAPSATVFELIPISYMPPALSLYLVTISFRSAISPCTPADVCADTGAALVLINFAVDEITSPELRAIWEKELGQMRNRIREMRHQLVEKLRTRVPSLDFDFVIRQRGMFSYSGLSKGAVDRLRDEFSVYAIDTGRICVAALNSRNIDHVTDAIAKVIG